MGFGQEVEKSDGVSSIIGDVWTEMSHLEEPCEWKDKDA